MGKTLIKSGLSAFVFGMVLFGMYKLAIARNGLQASTGDTLTVDKWNEMASILSGLQSSYSLLSGQVNTASYEIKASNCNDSVTCIVSCPSGKKAVGGGCSFAYTYPPHYQSYPYNSGAGWVCATDGSTANNVYVSVICMSVR